MTDHRQQEKKSGGTGALHRRFGWKEYALYYLGYTVLFCAAAAAVFIWFWLRKRRFVWQTDGVNQHYYGLLYFSRWGKEILRNLRETGTLRIPTFTLRMGYGEDLYTTLAYYVIGDPFSLPAVLIPERYLLVFHDLMLLARFYLAGITFSAYCFVMGRRSRIGVLAGALIYLFNGFTMSGMRHHYFLNPFVFFPLLLIGCERVFRKKKPGLFIFMVFLTAVSNFYFFYMMVIMTVLYAVWRSLRLRGLRRFGQVILDGISFVWYGIVGTLLSAFVFLPVVLRFLQDPRAADDKQIPWHWTQSFYRNFVDCFLTNGTSALAESWTYMGFGAVALLCILFIFVRRKKHPDLKAAFVGLTCLLLTPLAGYVLNGFSYPANRWMWAYALLIGYMAATAVPEMAEEAGTGELTAVLVLFGALVALCVGWKYTFSRDSAQAVIIGLFGFAAVLLGRFAMREAEAEDLSCADGKSDTGASPAGNRRRKISVRVQAALLVCVILTAVWAGYYDYAPTRSAKVFEYLSRAQIETQTAKDAAAASKLIDGQLLKTDGAGKTPFYRYTTYNPENNTSILYGVSNTQYYWSLSNASTSQFFNETGQLNRMIHLYDTLDDRTMLNEIAGIRYFLGNDADGVPFGYEKKEGLSYDNYDLWPENDRLDRFACNVYENRYALPFGFTSDRWISREDYEKMDIPQRQQALMQGILLEADPGGDFTQVSEGGFAFSDRRVPVQIGFDGAQISEKEDGKLSFTVEGQTHTVTVRFAGLPACETSLYIRGLQYEPPAGRAGSTKFLLSVTGYAGENEVAAKQIGFTTPRDPWTTGRKDFVVNMRYREEALDRIELALPAEGTFSVDAIEVVCQPMTEYPAQAQALRESGLTDLEIHEMGESFATEKITGHIELTAPKILCLQIPRTAGWTAYVDGIQAELLQADTMFSALLVPAGSHDIELRYQTPGLRLGVVISAGTLLLILLFGIIYTVIFTILGHRERRRAAVPAGTYTAAADMDETGRKPGFPEAVPAEGGETAHSSAAAVSAENAEPAEETPSEAGAADGAEPMRENGAEE